MIVTVVGARPQFVKAAVVSRALERAAFDERLVHTGQHYDARMSDVFWQELGLPEPARNLNVGSGPHGRQTAQIMERLEEYLTSLRGVRGVLLYGDTNSTVAGALVASKLGLPVVHVEAGLRSFNRAMPEEINRIITDHLAQIAFCSSPAAVEQLAREGIREGVFEVGDVMQDAVLTFVARARVPQLEGVEVNGRGFALLTLHRPANTDSEAALASVLAAIERLPVAVYWPLHPRVEARVRARRLPPNLVLGPAASYFEMLGLLQSCSAVLTDSGGLQKEAYWLKRRCITLREETEWTETLEAGWNQLAGVEPDRIGRAFDTAPNSEWKPLYGDGHAAGAIAQILAERLA